MNASVPKISVNPWLIALSVMLATFMEVLDTSIANVALGHIGGSLSASQDQATWVLTTYLIANAIVIPSTAWLGQRFGRKRFLLTCLAIFTVASFFCGLATSLPMLLAMRVIQGAGGGALQPIAQAVMLESFPKEKQGQAMGVYGLGVVVAPIIGPVLGGWITDNFDWRWIFYINVPFGLLAFYLIRRFVQDPPRTQKAPVRFDAIGLLFMSLWLGCQEVLLDKGQEEDWFGSRFIVMLTGLAVIGLITFVVREMKAKDPLVNLRVLNNRNFALGAVLIFFAGVTLYGLTAILPLFLQSQMGYTSYQSGLTMIPRGLGALIAMPLAGQLVSRIKGRYLVAAGFLSFGASAFTLAQITLEISPMLIFWPLFFSGVSIAFIFVPLNTLAMGGLKPEQISNAAGLFNLMRNVGGSVGISLVTTLVARGAQRHQSLLAAHLTPYDPAYQSSLATMQTAFTQQSGTVLGGQRALGSLYHTLVQQANVLAYLDTFHWFAMLCLACITAAFFLKNVKVSGPITAH